MHASRSFWLDIKCCKPSLENSITITSVTVNQSLNHFMEIFQNKWFKPCTEDFKRVLWVYICIFDCVIRNYSYMCFCGTELVSVQFLIHELVSFYITVSNQFLFLASFSNTFCFQVLTPSQQKPSPPVCSSMHFQCNGC